MRLTALGAVLAVAALGRPAPAQGGPPAPAVPTRVRSLVEDLGAPDYRVREKAGAALLGLGDRALPALKAALRGVDDAEAHRRLQVIVGRLELDRLVSPRRVTLRVKNKPVKGVVAELARQSGYPVRFDGGGDDKQRLTLDLAGVTFWEAADSLADAAGLSLNTNDEDGGLWLVANDTYNPHVSYAGPFKVVATNVNSGRTLQLANLNRRQPNPRQPEFLNLNFTVQSEPKAPLVGVGQPVVTAAVDDTGASLVPPAGAADDPNTAQYLPAAGVGYRSFSQGFAASLARADRSATAIKDLRGRVQVSLLADARPELTIDDLLTAKKKRVPGRTADVEVVAADYQNDTLSLEVTVRLKNGDPEDTGWQNGVAQRLEVSDAAGGRFAFGGVSNQTNGPNMTTVQLQFTVPAGKKLGKPARLQLVEWVTVTREVEFRFKDIPLP